MNNQDLIYVAIEDNKIVNKITDSIAELIEKVDNKTDIGGTLLMFLFLPILGFIFLYAVLKIRYTSFTRKLIVEKI